MRTLIAILMLGLLACSEQSSEQLGGTSYQLYSEGCESQQTVYWLMDMQVSNSADSIIFNTKKIGRKLELEFAATDSNASFIQLLAMLCPGDSMQAELSADSFYRSMGGMAPANVRDQTLHVKVVMADRLDELQYMAHKRLYEKEQMANYIERFRWNAQLDSSSGIYYEKLKTARAFAPPFKKAKMKYLVKTLSDQLVTYSKEGEPMVFDKEDKDLLPGLRFVGSLLHSNESIRAVIPSHQAYGPKGNERVKGHQPVVVEMELIEIIE